MKEDGRFERLFKKTSFLSCLIAVIIDEGHCIHTWGKFRPEYRELSRLRYRLHKDTPFAVASATLPTLVLKDVLDVLQIRDSTKLVHIRRSTDRPNVLLAVRRIEHPLRSFKDLACLFPNGGDEPPPPFLVFCDTVAKSIEAAKALWSFIGKVHHPEDKVKWYNSQMSDEYKQEQLALLQDGKIWGLTTTDAFGMVRNFPPLLSSQASPY